MGGGLPGLCSRWLLENSAVHVFDGEQHRNALCHAASDGAEALKLIEDAAEVLDAAASRA